RNKSILLLLYPCLSALIRVHPWQKNRNAHPRKKMSSKTYTVAVVGATGAVGEAMLSILAERQFPVGKLHVLASARSAGEKVTFGSQKLVLEYLAEFVPAGVDIALFSAGGSLSKEYAPKFAAAGAVVID